MEDRMKDRMTVLMVELENMRKRKEDWREERERMEKRLGKLEKKGEKIMAGEKWEKGRGSGEEIEAIRIQG